MRRSPASLLAYDAVADFEECGAITGCLALQADLIDRLYVAGSQKGSGIGTARLDHTKPLAADGPSPPPESEPDVEYAWRPSRE